jgi:hypothetical protein
VKPAIGLYLSGMGNMKHITKECGAIQYNKVTHIFRISNSKKGMPVGPGNEDWELISTDWKTMDWWNMAYINEFMSLYQDTIEFEQWEADRVKQTWNNYLLSYLKPDSVTDYQRPKPVLQQLKEQLHSRPNAFFKLIHKQTGKVSIMEVETDGSDDELDAINEHRRLFEIKQVSKEEYDILKRTI